jgi:hypothetical protein
MTYQYWLGGTTIGAGGCVLLANRASKGTAETAQIKVEANSNTSRKMFITAAGNHEFEGGSNMSRASNDRKGRNQEIRRKKFPGKVDPRGGGGERTLVSSKGASRADTGRREG